MIWAIRKGEKVMAQKGLDGYCPICNEKLIPKCGKIKMWHWGHKSNKNCDDWYELESEWNINWKNEFPKEQQEVLIKKNDKYHIADIKTKTGKIIELQHSQISIKEVKKRENFYGDMIWLLDGNTFGKNLILFNKKFIWRWMPSIIKYSKKNVFLDFKDYIIKISSRIILNGRILNKGLFQKYSKKQFLEVYGDLYDSRNN